MDGTTGSPGFWFEEQIPRQPTLERDLEVDALVVGGGLTGLTTAYLLSRAGVSVAPVERQRIASGDTGHTTAHLTAITDVRPHDLVKLLGAEKAAALWAANVRAANE